MKKCICCGAEAPPNQPTCLRCGEASWVVVITPETKVEEHTPTLRSSYSTKGKQR